jgi:2-polyprenyl-6-methoxyphenol hydroxylase-like FAD-dependent oxidoreductase
MQSNIKNIVIVGGGTAGWITAGLIAAKHKSSCVTRYDNKPVSITVIESPNVPTIGVGEGTWPSMRQTLKTIGIDEADLFKYCDASFKQASKFTNWVNSPLKSKPNISTSKTLTERSYYHPFSLPIRTSEFDLGELIGPMLGSPSAGDSPMIFAQQVCYQSVLCEQNLAPKQITLKAYDYIANYGYHLDATKFSALLKKHCIDNLNVKHVMSHIVSVNNDVTGDIEYVSTDTQGDVHGDLFIDCSGAQSLLLGKHFNIPFCSKKSVLFNDTALAIQVPYDSAESPIASCTHSTAQSSGWIWDIGLQSRRGVGHVYSSQHSSDENAERDLRQYVAQITAKDIDDLSIRKLSFNPGYHEKFWHRNCVAVGMSAGFIEPLEASALAMIEQAATMISEQLPTTKLTMGIIAKRFNDKFLNHWQQIIEFLKLHYVLSQRDDSEYWLDNKDLSSVPDDLQDKLALWKYQAPSAYDIPHATPLFPAASYQFILYGMKYTTLNTNNDLKNNLALNHVLADVQNKRLQLGKILEPNRVLINKIKQYGLTKF